MENQQRNQNEQQQRNDFGYSADRIDQRGLFDNAQKQEIEAPDQNRAADDGCQIVAAGKIGREKVIERIHGDNGIADVAADLAQPV